MRDVRGAGDGIELGQFHNPDTDRLFAGIFRTERGDFVREPRKRYITQDRGLADALRAFQNKRTVGFGAGSIDPSHRRDHLLRADHAHVLRVRDAEAQLTIPGRVFEVGQYRVE
jgi:hypothetical protein